MERRGFFKSLLGVLMLPFAKDLMKEIPKRPSSVTVNFTKTVPVRFSYASTGWTYWSHEINYNGDIISTWKSCDNSASIDRHGIQGKFISIDEAIETWSGT